MQYNVRMVRTDVKFTVEEYMALPEAGPRYQLVAGDLIMSPAPKFEHQDILARLFNALYNHVHKNQLGKVLCAPLDVHLSDEDIFQPDIVYIGNGRKKIIQEDGLHGMPDLCVEILSPSNRRLDLKTKRLQYVKFGLEEYWIVDPDACEIQLFRLQENPAKPIFRLSEEETLTTPVLPGFSVKLAAIFGD